METPSADVQQEQQRAIMRGVMQGLWEHIVGQEDAPEGIELFEWHTLPQVDTPAVELILTEETTEDGPPRITIPR